MTITCWFCLCLITNLVGCSGSYGFNISSQGNGFQDSKQIDENTLLITDFDSEITKQNLTNAKSQIVKEPTDAKNKCLKANLDIYGANIGITNNTQVWNFTSYDRLLIDYVREGSPCTLNFKIRDKNQKLYTCWYNQMDKGKGTIEISIAGIASQLDLSQIKSMFLSCEQPVGEVLLDRIQLVKGFEDRLKDDNNLPEQQNTNVRSHDAVSGNLIPNGSFELGMNQWHSWGKWDGGEYVFGSESKLQNKELSIPHGDIAITISCLKPGRGGIYGKSINLESGVYDFSVYVKSDKPGGKFRWALVGPGVSKIKPHPDHTTDNVDTDWIEIKSSFQASPGANDVKMYLFNIGSTELVIDDVRLIIKGGSKEQANESLKPIDGIPSDFSIDGRFLTKDGKPFFPIGIYCAPPDKLVGTGFNMIVPLETVSLDLAYLNLCQKSGVFVSPNFTGIARSRLPHRTAEAAEALYRHPAIMGWYLCDEPDHVAWNVPPVEIRNTTRYIRSKNIKQPTWTCVMAWAESNYYQYANSVDILASDVYPIMDRNKPQPLTLIADKVDLLRKVTYDLKPVFLVAQATGKETPEELTAMTYLGLTHGASGIIYWEYPGASSNPKNWSTNVRLAQEMNLMTPILTAPESKIQIQCNNPAIHCSVRELDGIVYVLTVNSENQEQSPVKFDMKIPKALGDGRVIFESRSIEMKNDRFTDRYLPYERHVYEFKTTDAKDR